MTADPDLDRCPKCNGEDVLVVALTNYATGTVALLACQSCAVSFQRWAPRPVAGSR